MRSFLRTTAWALLAALWLQGCSDSGDPDPDPVAPVPPTISVALGAVTRTSAEFSISTDGAADYAWTIVPQTETIASAEELFSRGEVAMLSDPETVGLKSENLTGGNKYTLYAAVRKINPYVYSTLCSVEVDTEIAYTQTITMDHIGKTDYAYHVEWNKPGVKYKHISLPVVDLEWYIDAMSWMGFTEATYVDTFGFPEEASGTFSYDKMFLDYWEGQTYIYSGMETAILLVELDENGKALPGTLEKLVFTTQKAGESPYKIAVSLSEIGSITAKAEIVPEAGIVNYRAVVASAADYDYVSFEGDMSVRRMIIDKWDDTSNEYSGPVSLDANGLRPNSSYYVCIVGFDEQGRERLVTVPFVTGEPTGPKPEIELTPLPELNETPWSAICMNIKVRNAATVYVCLETAANYQKVLDRGVSYADIIASNGVVLPEEMLAKALSADGLSAETGSLTPETDYIYGVYAVNEEYVGEYGLYEFRTDVKPPLGGELRTRLLGDYTATIDDKDGKTWTFPVKIAAGVNEATTAEYSKKDRLVCLGFAPCGFDYASPEETLAKGWAADAAEADVNYGPKWFIQFQDDGSIRTVPATENYTIVNYMGIFGGDTYCFCGYYYRANRDTYTSKWTEFEVEVSDDCRTLTVKPNEYESFGTAYVDYPGITKNSGNYGGGEQLFIGGSALVLTRNAAAETSALQACSGRGALTAPRKVAVGVAEGVADGQRRDVVAKISR